MGNTSDNGNTSADDAAKESQKRRLQMELLILDSDTRKLTSEKGILDAEIRKLTQDGERIRLNLDSKKGRFDVVVREIASKEEDTKHLKKKLNEL
jgi:chromosome segregation ATPase